MSKLTLEDAISHCLEVAEEHTKYNSFGGFESCDECAKEHRQLAEWLRELKEAKRLLKAAVEDINYYVVCFEAHCDECCCNHNNHCHWEHEGEALALIGGTDND